MDGVGGGTIKRVLFGLVKSGKIVINSAEDFAIVAENAIPSISTIYVSSDDDIAEPADVENAPAIKGTLNIHKVQRSYYTSNAVCYLEFYELSSDLKPIHKQFYRRDGDPIICGHA